MARAHGLVPEHVYEVALRGFSAAIPDARVPAVKNDARVKYVEQDQFVEAFGQELPTGVDRVDADLSPTATQTQNAPLNVDVAIIDTGIDYSHPDLYVVGGRNCTGGNPKAYGDGNGHGRTWPAPPPPSTTAWAWWAWPPSPRLWAVRVLNSRGSGLTSWVIKGIDWTADTTKHPRIEAANMSLGGGYSQAC